VGVRNPSARHGQIDKRDVARAKDLVEFELAHEAVLGPDDRSRERPFRNPDFEHLDAVADETVLPDERIVGGHDLAAHVLHAFGKPVLEPGGQEPERDDQRRDEDGKRDIPAAKA
jgi:hypothetical protein